MPELVQIKAQIPRELKRRAFVVLAEREEKFTCWLKRQLEDLLHHPDTQGEQHECSERT